MSSGGGYDGGIGGSDESFTAFAFAVVSVAVLLMYLPWLTRTIMGTYKYYTTTPVRRGDVLENPLVEIASSWAFIPSVLLTLAASPSMLVTGANICMKDKVFFLRCCMPKFLRFMIRPKILVLWLWFVLFSSTMYSTLTFDPHSILGVPSTASTGDIKKAYRALSKIYHPDQNKTEAARVVYVELRRAYKALVDREAFEEEEAQSQQEVSVGVGLPRFMTNQENGGFVLFGLLGVLFAVPFGLWYKFRSNNQIPKLVKHAHLDRERVETFLGIFGIPADPKYLERCASQQKILETLKSLGLAPSTATLSMVINFPSFVEFVARCMEPEKYRTALMNLGFEDQGIITLQAHFTKVGPDEVDAFLAAHPPIDTTPQAQLLSAADYRAAKYLFEQHTQQVDDAMETLVQTLPFEVRTPRKLVALHKEIYELLDLVYKAEKPLLRHVQNLVDMPRRVGELLSELEPEMDKSYRKSIKQYMEQQAQGKVQRRQMKMMHRQMGL